VSDDLKSGEHFGVTGTPAFFINGRRLTGAQPFAAFQQIIDDELERIERVGL
jgi:protein-disulfide isomerase